MKLLFYTLFTTIITTSLFSQSLTNGGFETWTGGNPMGWSTTHSSLATSTLEKQETSIVYQGSSAIKITSDDISNPVGATAAGFAHYGTSRFDASSSYFYQNAFPFAGRPDSLQFAYKYVPSGSDSGGLALQLSRGGRTKQVGYITMALRATASYKLVTVPITYVKTTTPDSLDLTFYASDVFSPAKGSILYLDAVKFIYKNVINTGIDQPSDIQPLHLYPNPAHSDLHMQAGDNQIGMRLHIFNLLGSEVLQRDITDSSLSIDISPLENSIYLYRITDKTNKTTSIGRFTKE